ncbi:MAG: hypothetical protein AB1540_04800 [Bdellovibrionota bacterium]
MRGLLYALLLTFLLLFVALSCARKPDSLDHQDLQDVELPADIQVLESNPDSPATNTLRALGVELIKTWAYRLGYRDFMIEGLNSNYTLRADDLKAWDERFEKVTEKEKTDSPDGHSWWLYQGAFKTDSSYVFYFQSKRTLQPHDILFPLNQNLSPSALPQVPFWWHSTDKLYFSNLSEERLSIYEASQDRSYYKNRIEAEGNWIGLTPAQCLAEIFSLDLPSFDEQEGCQPSAVSVLACYICGGMHTDSVQEFKNTRLVDTETHKNGFAAAKCVQYDCENRRTLGGGVWMSVLGIREKTLQSRRVHSSIYVQSRL